MVSPLVGTVVQRTAIPLRPCAILSRIPGSGSSHGQLVFKRGFHPKSRTTP